jgi:hypothetical protein
MNINATNTNSYQNLNELKLIKILFSKFIPMRSSFQCDGSAILTNTQCDLCLFYDGKSCL